MSENKLMGCLSFNACLTSPSRQSIGFLVYIASFRSLAWWNRLPPIQRVFHVPSLTYMSNLCLGAPDLHALCLPLQPQNQTLHMSCIPLLFLLQLLFWRIHPQFLWRKPLWCLTHIHFMFRVSHIEHPIVFWGFDYGSPLFNI